MTEETFYSKYRYYDENLSFREDHAQIISNQLKTGNRLSLRTVILGKPLTIGARYYIDEYDRWIYHMLLTNDDRRELLRRCQKIIEKKMPYLSA